MSLCLTRECLLTCSRRVKSLPQMSQLKERTPEWMIRCLFSVRRCLAMQLQWGHLSLFRAVSDVSPRTEKRAHTISELLFVPSFSSVCKQLTGERLQLAKFFFSLPHLYLHHFLCLLDEDMARNKQGHVKVSCLWVMRRDALPPALVLLGNLVKYHQRVW